MKKDINQFLHNTEKWSNILKISAGIQTQDFKSMFGNFSTLWRKGLNYNFQTFFKGIISIIFCKTLTLRDVETLQSIACSAILPENPSQAHTWAIPNISDSHSDRNESYRQSI